MSRSGNSERKCGYCGKTGHYRSTCPKIKERSSSISVNPSTDEDILQFSPNKSKSVEKTPVKRVLRPRTRSAVAAAKNAVVDNSNDSDFQPSSNSASDFPDILDSQEAEDLVAGLQEVLDATPPKTAAKASKKKTKSNKKKKKQAKRSSANTPPRRVTPSAMRSAYTPLNLHKVQPPAHPAFRPPVNSKVQQGRPLLPMNPSLNQRCCCCCLCYC